MRIACILESCEKKPRSPYEILSHLQQLSKKYHASMDMLGRPRTLLHEIELLIKDGSLEPSIIRNARHGPQRKIVCYKVSPKGLTILQLNDRIRQFEG